MIMGEKIVQDRLQIHSLSNFSIIKVDNSYRERIQRFGLVWLGIYDKPIRKRPSKAGNSAAEAGTQNLASG